MAGALVIERKVGAGMADLADTAIVAEPGQCRCCARRRRPVGLVGRVGRVARESVQDIHQDKFLMLLFVVPPQHHQRSGDVPVVNQVRTCPGGEAPLEPDMSFIVDEHGARRNTRAPPTAGRASVHRMAGADSFVIGVEQKDELVAEGLIAARVGNQNQRFEKPGNVGAVPLGRAGVLHRLDDLVLFRQWRGQPFGFAANPQEMGQ